MSSAEARLALSEEPSLASLTSASRLAARHLSFGDSDLGRDLLIRCLEWRHIADATVGDYLNHLCAMSGLYPYVERSAATTLRDRVAIALHSPATLRDRGIVFHTEQAAVLGALERGESVILSAPTSFGKSLIIDAFVAGSDFNRVAVVVPTLALLDETRRRLTATCPAFQVVTHTNQPAHDKVIYVLTAERATAMETLGSLDFFVIDEFYKLTARAEDDRVPALNLAFQKLLSTKAQFLMIGPKVAEIDPGVIRLLGATWIHTDVTTVAATVIEEPTADLERPSRAAALLESYGDSTVVFCKSQAQIRKVVEALPEHLPLHEPGAAFADWLATNYAEDWYVARAVARGVGIHHARLPRAVAHHMVRLFNRGDLRALIVTSSFIEGVNTRAKNLIIADNKISTRKYDYFTYANIVGRAGRMKQHLVGRVHILAPPPSQTLFEVDFPIVTQPESMSDEIAILVDADVATSATIERQRQIAIDSALPIDLLRDNSGMSIRSQEAVAERITRDPRKFLRAMTWPTGQPNSAQVKELAEYLFDLTGGSGAAKTPKQLGALMNMFRHHAGDPRALYLEALERPGEYPVDLESILEFSRQYLQFKLPNALGALERIGQVVGALPTAPPSTGAFASALESQFQAPYTSSLEEYGLPTPLSRRLAPQLSLASHSSLDEVLATIVGLDTVNLPISMVEADMLRDVQEGIKPNLGSPLW